MTRTPPGPSRSRHASKNSRVARCAGTYGSITYDANGSRTFKDKGAGTKDEFVYDARGALTQVKRWTSGSVTSSQTNLYDYAGARVVRAPSSGAGTTIRSYNRYAQAGGGNLEKYFYLGDRLVATWTVSAPTLSEVEPELLVPPARITFPPGLLLPAGGAVLLLLFLPLGRRRRLGVRLSLARSASLSVVFLTASTPVILLSGCGSDPVVRLFHVDRLGSTQVVTDWNGAIYRQMRYYAYGEIRGRFDASGANASYAEDARYEFTGYETDFAGLDYANARFFDPELGQFGSHDRAGQYPSPYAYGPGDPINGADPSGTWFGIDDAILITIAIYAYQAAIVAGLAATATFIDTYRQTGSGHAALSAAGESIANSATGGGYGAVKAISNDESGHYLASYAANIATLGIYGTVVAFQNGQIGTGILGVVQIAAIAYGTYSAYHASSAVVSGNETTNGNSGPVIADGKGEPAGATIVIENRRIEVGPIDLKAPVEQQIVFNDATGPLEVKISTEENLAWGKVTVTESTPMGDLSSRRSFIFKASDPKVINQTFGTSSGFNPRTVTVEINVQYGNVTASSFATVRTIRIAPIRTDNVASISP